jgi:hypothetical protein
MIRVAVIVVAVIILDVALAVGVGRFIHAGQRRIPPAP